MLNPTVTTNVCLIILIINLSIPLLNCDRTDVMPVK